MDVGIPASRGILEQRGRDTLESVRFCHDLIQRKGDCANVVCCTSRYHQPRCALLLRMLGYTVIVPQMQVVRGQLSWVGLGRLFARELLAIPYDALLMVTTRMGIVNRAAS